MLKTQKQHGALTAAFPADGSAPWDHGLAWLGKLRLEAIDGFARLGLPTAQNEDWRFTPMDHLAERGYRPAPEFSGKAPEIPIADVPRLDGGQLVFINGRAAGELTGPIDSGWQGRCLSLAAAAARPDSAALLREFLGSLACVKNYTFAALNTAMFRDMAVIHVPRGAVMEKPLNLVFIARPTSGEGPIQCHPRVLIVAEQEAECRIVETHLGLDGGAYLTNPVIEIVVKNNAQVEHHRLIHDAEESIHVSQMHAHVGRSGRLIGHVYNFGRGLVRHNFHPIMGGEGAHCDLSGLTLVARDEHVDNALVVDHAEPHGDSREFFKAVLSDQARSIFSGKIIVRPGAQKTDAKQTNMSLLLSDDARVESKPQLEIFADDVKCTHGATIGQVNRDAIFYLMTRGLPEAAARDLLIHAFAREVIDRGRIEALREHLNQCVERRLKI